MKTIGGGVVEDINCLGKWKELKNYAVKLVENKNIEKNTWYYSPKEEARNDLRIRNQTLELLKKIRIYKLTIY